MKKNKFQEIDKELTKILNGILDEALGEARKIYSMPDMNQKNFHAYIGTKNAELGGVVDQSFSNSDHYIDVWVGNLVDRAAREKKIRGNSAGTYGRLLQLFECEPTRSYLELFLQRNFFRNWEARTRSKPTPDLWSLWFGKKGFEYGLLISPRLSGGIWENDVSEIRRANFKYWTIGHVLSSGLVEPLGNSIIKFESFGNGSGSSGELLTFLSSVLSKQLDEHYELPLWNRYLEYLRQSSNVEDEPFLIPELRFESGKKHEYRLDFTVFNSHIMKFVGIELSPASTHMSVDGWRSPAKTQEMTNEELKKYWEYEMKKRREYFHRFGISTQTYTDSQLHNLESIFGEVRGLLEPRGRVTSLPRSRFLKKADHKS